MCAGRILVIDDSPETCEYVAEVVLRPAGYEPLVAYDGETGLELAFQAAPDLVLADMRMPGISGLEVARRLQAAGQVIPLILITGTGSEDVARQALRAGVADYLIKPFRVEELLGSIQRALDIARARRERLQARAELEASHRALQAQLREQETLMEVGRQVTASLDVDRVLLTVVEAAVSLTGAEEGALLLLDENTHELTMRAAKNFDDSFVHAFRLPSADSLAGQVIRTGQPVLLGPGSPRKIKTTYLVQSLVYVPIQVRARSIGVLGVDNRTANRAFNPHDQKLLQALSDYAAIAIENARLYSHTDAERAKLETVMEETDDGVIVVGDDQRVMLINHAARQALGLQAESVIGQEVARAIPHPDLRDLLTGESRRAEVACEDGRVFNANRTSIQGVGQAVVMQDITHLKDLDRIKSDFVTTVSHDLRSPLTAIMGYVDLISRTGPVNEQQAEFIRRIQFSVQSITTLVSDLLDLGRIEAGFDAQKEVTPLALVLRYTLEGLAQQVEVRRQTLTVDMAEDLPRIHANPPRLRQMLANLIDNAIKYTPDGGRVEVTARAEGDFVILTVRDSGMGIPPADQPYIFDKFYRASNARAEQPGTGLGLAIVRSIVENHGGRIWVESRVGEGSTFTVMLPRYKEDAARRTPE